MGNNCMIRKSKSVKEIFESFGEVDHVMTHSGDTCFVRMKRSLDATKIVMLFKNHVSSDSVCIDFAPYYHESSQSMAQVVPKLEKRSMSLPMPMQQQQQQLRQPMLSHARTGNGYAEYMKYQYQCYALWHQQQSNEYYAALMKYQQQQQQQYGQVQGGYRQGGTSNQCTV